MPRAYTQKIQRVAGEGFLARLQFSREPGYDEVLVSSAVVSATRTLPDASVIRVQTLQRDGTLIDSVSLTPNGVGGAQVGLHLLSIGGHAKFQVVVHASGAGVLEGTLTAAYGLTTETSTLLKSSIDAAGGVVECAVLQNEIVVNGGCKVPEPCQRDIAPLFARVALVPNYVPGVVVPPDRSCHGGVQVIP